ncbi:MAG TPA: Ig-like domain-containing protein, partial [Polyangiaceae bacterium]|nr:Ig-like domain-containing protein [Polyangiaceae bacterium]
LLGTEALSPQGAATLTTGGLAAGAHNITATYSGDANYVGSSSSALAETVSLAQPMVMLSGPANAVDVGTAVLLTGTLTGPGVTPTGTLTLMDGATALSTQTVTANGRYSFSTSSLSLGTHSLSVVYSGDSDNATATSATSAVVIQLAPTAIAVSTSANPGTVGQPITLTASLASDSAGISGTVSFMDGAASVGTTPVSASRTATLTIPALGFGVHSITASYSGDAQHAASSSAVLSERMTESAMATLTSNANPAIAGLDVALTATLAASGGQSATGTVVFSDGGVTLGSAALNGAGVAVLHTSSLPVGQHAITASYAGDTNVAGASANLTETVVSATSQVSLSSSTALATYGSPLTLTAAVTTNGMAPSGQVTFTDNGTAIGTVDISAQGVAILTTSALPPGNHNVVAQYAGDARTAVANSIAVSVVVKQGTSLLVSSSANPALTMSEITVTATLAGDSAAAASGAVTFSDSSNVLGTATLNGNGVASLSVPSLSAGSHSITASYAGDGRDFGSSSPALVQV